MNPTSTPPTGDNGPKTQGHCMRPISPGEMLYNAYNEIPADDNGKTWHAAGHTTHQKYEAIAEELIGPYKNTANMWQDTAQQYARDLEHRYKALDTIAQCLGVDVFMCDDGSVSQDPLFAKIPQLVAEQSTFNLRVSAALTYLMKFVNVPSPDLTPERVVAATIATILKSQRQYENLAKDYDKLAARGANIRREADSTIEQRNKTITELTEQVTREQETNRENEKRIASLVGGMSPANAVLSFACWLTIRPVVLCVGSNQDCAPMAQLVERFLGANNMKLAEPLQKWEAPPEDYVTPVKVAPFSTVELYSKEVPTDPLDQTFNAHDGSPPWVGAPGSVSPDVDTSGQEDPGSEAAHLTALASEPPVHPSYTEGVGAGSSPAPTPEQEDTGLSVTNPL